MKKIDLKKVFLWYIALLFIAAIIYLTLHFTGYWTCKWDMLSGDIIHQSLTVK